MRLVWRAQEAAAAAGAVAGGLGVSLRQERGDCRMVWMLLSTREGHQGSRHVDFYLSRQLAVVGKQNIAQPSLSSPKQCTWHHRYTCNEMTRESREKTRATIGQLRYYLNGACMGGCCCESDHCWERNKAAEARAVGLSDTQLTRRVAGGVCVCVCGVCVSISLL